jgi:hypothetical protein
MAKKATKRLPRSNRGPKIEFRVGPLEYQAALKLRPKAPWLIKEKDRMSSADAREIFRRGLTAIAGDRDQAERQKHMAQPLEALAGSTPNKKAGKRK